MPLKTLLLSTCLLSTSALAGTASHAPSPQGIAYPEGWQQWATISVSHRHDNHTLRVILGNDIAVKAARAGQTSPWPDGAILGKVVWKEMPEADWPTAIAPKSLVHAEFMFKDSQSPNGTGWRWARWLGMDQQPFDKGEKTERVCIDCHTPVEKRDWVFTTPAPFPF